MRRPGDQRGGEGLAAVLWRSCREYARRQAARSARPEGPAPTPHARRRARACGCAGRRGLDQTTARFCNAPWADTERVTGIEPALPAWEVGTSDRRSPAEALTCVSPMFCVRDRDRPL